MPDERSDSDGFDAADKAKAIREADVLVVGFECLKERLLVDARRNDQAGPYVRVVQPVLSPQDRLRQLRELRPSFNDPESFVFFPGQTRVKTFVEEGHFDDIMERCAGDDQAIADCRTALEELLQLDAADLRQAIAGGDRYHTLYERVAP